MRDLGIEGKTAGLDN